MTEKPRVVKYATGSLAAEQGSTEMETRSAKARNYAIAAAATAVALLSVRILLMTFGIFGPGFMD